MAPSKPRIVEAVADMQTLARNWREAGKRIAFVPTMGYLHEGHAALLRRGRELGDVLVLSIFVNPTQFGPTEDFDEYPRDLEHDAVVAASSGVDVIFTPTQPAMYPSGYQTWIDVTETTQHLCGANRPGHFRGVTTVVAKLFNIVQPHVAVFGRKDFQQLVTIRQMVGDLNMDVEIEAHEIVRESDGLALSSRNTYLDSTQRANALTLQRGLDAARTAFENGERSAAELIATARDEIESAPGAEVDYVSLVDAQTVQPIVRIEAPALLAVAVKFGDTRLIDNVVLGDG